MNLRDDTIFDQKSVAKKLIEQTIESVIGKAESTNVTQEVEVAPPIRNSSSLPNEEYGRFASFVFGDDPLEAQMREAAEAVRALFH